MTFLGQFFVLLESAWVFVHGLQVSQRTSLWFLSLVCNCNMRRTRPVNKAACVVSCPQVEKEMKRWIWLVSCKKITKPWCKEKMNLIRILNIIMSKQICSRLQLYLQIQGYFQLHNYLSEWRITSSDDIQKWRHYLKDTKDAHYTYLMYTIN